VADTWNHRVERFDKTGKFLGKWGGFVDAKGQVGVQPGSFWGPRDLAVAPNGNVVVSDAGNKRIQVFDSEGRFITMFGGDGTDPGKLKEPVGLAVDSEGNVYVADTWNHRIQKFDSQYKPVAQFPVAGWESQSVANKPYLSVDSTGRIYFTVPEKRQFVVIRPNGQQEGVKGAQGTDPASFGLPVGIVVAPQGDVYVADTGNSRILKYQSWR
jgi:streptogramin lyase